MKKSSNKKVVKSKKEKKVEKVLHEYKDGKLHSGSKKGPKVKSRKQAIAIGLSEASRAAGDKVKSAAKKASDKVKSSSLKASDKVKLDARKAKDKVKPAKKRK